MEDKKCRLCGYADMANTNIFTMNAKFVEKIVAVFPIVLYANDPLPKHICKKCVGNVGNTYGDIERAIKNQNKWISNVRSVQPDNSYVKAVDAIESANKQTAELVSKVAGEDIGARTVCHLFNVKMDDQYVLGKPRNSVRSVLPSSADKLAPIPVQMEVDVDIPVFASIEPTRAVSEQPAQTILQKPGTKITQLKSALELNGCTLTKLKSPPKPVSEPVPHEVLPEVLDIKIEIKEELPFYEEYTESVNTVECKMCPFRCETVEELAIHQLNHLRIPLTRILDRRFLDKRIRRGRLIRIEEKKCIRCLNCWRIFVDNKSILHHWSIGDCEFFCRICGKEFALSPKMLREHVPAAHGISYRSSKLLRAPAAIITRPIKAEKSPMKSEPSPTKSSPKGSTPSVALSVRVACNICLKVFANFKARNSHMRAHKHPPLLPPLKTSTLTETLRAFNRTHALPPVKQEPQDYDNIPFHVVKSQDETTPSTSSKVVPPQRPALYPQLRSPPSKTPQRQNVAIRTNGPPGVRTKFVQSRPDPNAIVFKPEPRSSSQVLKVKSLVDLQDPSISSQHTEASLRVGPPPPPENGVANSNGLGVSGATKDNMNYAQIFNCHPCGGKFTSKLELFRHKRKCTANNLYPCQFCNRHFLTSADLQMHIMLLHKNSASTSALM